MIHRYWTGPDEPTITGPVGYVWHDRDLPPELTAWCDTRMSQTCSVDFPRHRANMVRWWLLATHGGTWLDHDASLHGQPPDPSFVGFQGRATCAVVSLTPNHPLAWAMLNHIETQPPSDRPCPQVSGDIVLHDLLSNTPGRFGVRLEPIPSPDADPTWVHHGWVTSRARAAR